MKIQVLSDLHIEFRPFDIPDTDADVVVLAGDIHLGIKGIIWAIKNIPNKPVIYVLGNHEYYGQTYPKLIKKLKEASAGTNVQVLENELTQIGGVNFSGCTLWTDFELFGDPRTAGYHASQRMTDFRRIRVMPNYSKMRSVDASVICKKSVRWLRDTLAQSGLEPLVIVTHHAPSKKSIPPHYQEDLLSAAYASHLDDLVVSCGSALWIHGHLHEQFDYKTGLTRIICNPRGYPDEPNYFFNPELVVEV